MEKKKDFIMVPRSIDKDERLDPWLQKHGVNRHALLWAVERMIDKLRMESKPMSVDDLLKGLNERHLPYKTLKEIVTMSGFFDCDGKKVRYNWKRFINEQPQEQSQDQLQEPSQMPSQCRLNAASMPSSTCARTSSSANRRVQYIETEKETENISHTKKEKEKKESAPISGDGYESRIHDIVQHYPFREGELVGWGGKSEVENRARLEKCLIGLLNDQYSSMAQKVGSYLKQKDYRERWRDIVMAYVVQLDGTGTMSRLANVSQVRHYFFALAKQNDEKSRAYQAGLCMAEELEEKRKAKIEEEKKRFPFEDYDPERGTRYVGNDLIPWDAPPRPDSRSLWDDDDKQWVSPEVLDEKRAAGIARLEAMMAKHPLMTS